MKIIVAAFAVVACLLLSLIIGIATFMIIIKIFHWITENL